MDSRMEQEIRHLKQRVSYLEKAVEDLNARDYRREQREAREEDYRREQRERRE